MNYSLYTNELFPTNKPTTLGKTQYLCFSKALNMELAAQAQSLPTWSQQLKQVPNILYV